MSEAVDVPRPARTPPVLLTQEQVRVFLEAVRDDRHFALYVTASTTGMRLGELLGLRWSDVDLAAGVLSVNQVDQTVHKRGAILSETKTDKSRRAIDLPAVTVAALREHRA